MADTDPGREPETAHILLGLPGTASRAAVEGAYWRLRGHIEERVRASRDPGFASARQAELERLHRALIAIPGVSAVDVGPGDPLARRTPRWLIAWALLAVPLTLGLAAVVLLDHSGDMRDSEPRPTASDPRLIVTADPASAELVVTTGDDQRVVLSAPADGQPQTLAPGRYALTVAHPDCPDTWQLAIELEADEERRYAPSLCVGEGRLVVRSNVSGDRVRIDGVDVGSTGADVHELRVGRHRIQVDKVDHAPWSGEVEIEADRETTLIAELDSLAPKTASAATQAPPATAAARPPAVSPPPTASRAGQDTGATSIGKNTSGRPIPLRTGMGGSKSWHDAIKQDLVSQYDRNGSSSLDTPEEIDAISCDTWLNIERSYETGGLVVTMTNLYGFDGSEAPANTLGVTASVRDHAYERMKECGLKARP
jgi:hypothetical protein